MREVDVNNPFYQDFLKEISNIGAGNAASSLSILLNQKVNLNVPSLEFIDLKDISSLLGDPSSLVVATLAHLQFDFKGYIMFILDVNTAKSLANELLRADDKNMDYFSNLELDAINEIGNILFNSYATAFGKFTKKTIVPSLNYTTYDMAGAILSVPAIETGIYSDKILLLQSTFESISMAYNGYLLLIPDEESFKSLINGIA